MKPIVSLMAGRLVAGATAAPAARENGAVTAGSTFWNPFSNMAETLERARRLRLRRGRAPDRPRGQALLRRRRRPLVQRRRPRPRADRRGDRARQAEKLAACSLLRPLRGRRHARGRRPDRRAGADRRRPRSSSPAAAPTASTAPARSSAASSRLRGEPERTVIIAREGAYHGMHAYGTSLAGIPGNHDGWGDAGRARSSTSPPSTPRRWKSGSASSAPTASPPSSPSR